MNMTLFHRPVEAKRAPVQKCYFVLQIAPLWYLILVIPQGVLSFPSWTTKLQISVFHEHRKPGMGTTSIIKTLPTFLSFFGKSTYRFEPWQAQIVVPCCLLTSKKCPGLPYISYSRFCTQTTPRPLHGQQIPISRLQRLHCP